MDDHLLGVVANIGLFSFLALSAYLILVTGDISFGQQAYFALSAYASGIATAVWGTGLAAGIAFGCATAAAAAFLVAWPTLRLRGLYFAVGTLVFAEVVRLLLEIFTYQRTIDGEPVGPAGSEGFRGIRYIFDNDISLAGFTGLIWLLLGLLLLGLVMMERTRFGRILRMIGEDPVLAECQGVNRIFYKVAAAVLAGAIAGLGGALYAHFNTYIEPKNFGIMIGVHSLAYGLIGGLGTALGPILGVLIDIGFLESVQAISSFRMIVFGGLVALLLIFRPRGLLDEPTVRRIERLFRRPKASARERPPS